MYKNGKDKSWLLIIISLIITFSAMLVDSTNAGDSDVGLTWSIAIFILITIFHNNNFDFGSET